ncbi:DUF3810 family protein [Leptobacterium flavescens]|uniref:DUF3810 family protein n=1 Tax=Leptobacterium flavescens TaxID=472055 RepID=A0A6P0UUR1_9FLAO|nr:DUF3810 domain-containing protein [Leptobacterium flavescens]NER14146.1 DUF3810 family protein [Leptobacterium flavescens]
MTKRMKTIIAFSIIPQVILVKILAKHPELIEKYYSNGFYPYLSKGFRLVFGWIPFSVGDIFYTIATILIIRFLILKGRMFFYQTRNFFREVFVVISVLYFVFHLFWGLNYYRLPIYQSLNIDNDYTTEELFEFTDRLIAKANEVHYSITKNDTVMVSIPYSKRKIYKMTVNGFNKLSAEMPNLTYAPTSIKSSIYSTVLTYMGYGGYLNPFTNEAQVNSVAFSYKYPTVSCHEQAHQLGYSAENEANFIGYLAAVNNEDIYFKYSAYIYSLRYCLGEIRSRDPEKFREVNKKMNPGIIKNYINVSNFWKRYENKAEPAFKTSFNTFLKANNQKDGIKSYSYVVALLVNYYKNKEL